MVISPAIGGVVLGTEVGTQLGCRTIFAERQEGKMVIRRGFHIEKGEKVLVVEDVITTGGSVREVMELVEDCLLYTSPSPRDVEESRMPSSA